MAATNGDLPELILRVTIGDGADHAAVLDWMRRFVIPAYFTAPVDVQLEVRVSDRPDE